jgi:ABC-type siderophore export system fused ATPase/permease subunit
VVTHDDRIFEFADRIARMEDGRITRIENPPTRGNEPQKNP